MRATLIISRFNRKTQTYEESQRRPITILNATAKRLYTPKGIFDRATGQPLRKPEVWQTWRYQLDNLVD